MLINTLIVNTSEVSDRRKIRSTYLPAEIYDMFKEDELEEDIKEQIGIYEEELENDKVMLEKEAEVFKKQEATMDDKARRARSQYVLENDGDLERLRGQVDQLIGKLMPRKPGPPPPPPPPPKLRPKA